MSRRGEIEFKHIAGVNAQPSGRVACAQILDNVAVNFDDVEMVQTLQQRKRQCSQAWPNFDEALAGLRSDGSHHLFDHAPIFEEMLTKALARPVRDHGGPACDFLRREFSRDTIWMIRSSQRAILFRCDVRSEEHTSELQSQSNL